MSDVTGFKRVKEEFFRHLQEFAYNLYASNPIKGAMMISVGSGVLCLGLSYSYCRYYGNRWKDSIESNQKWVKEQNQAHQEKLDWQNQELQKKLDWQNQELQKKIDWQNQELQKKIDSQLAGNQQWTKEQNQALQKWAEREFLYAEKKFTDFFEKAGPILALDENMNKRIQEIVESVLNSKTMQHEVEKLAIQKHGEAYNVESARQLIPSDVIKNMNNELLTRIEEGSNAVLNDDKIQTAEKARAVANLAVVEGSKMQAKFFEHIASSMNKGNMDKLPRL